MKEDNEIQSYPLSGSGSLDSTISKGLITMTVAAAPPPPPPSSQGTITLALPHQQSSKRGGGGGREDCWRVGATSMLIDAWARGIWNSAEGLSASPLKNKAQAYEMCHQIIIFKFTGIVAELKHLKFQTEFGRAMNSVSHQFAAQPPWFPMPPPSCASFWDNLNVRDRLRDLQATLDLAKSMQRELEMLMIFKEGKSAEQSADNDTSISKFSECLEDGRINLELQESRSVEAVVALMRKLRAQLHPLRMVSDESSPWEEKHAAVRLSNKLLKAKRNKLWRKKKRKRFAESLAKERGNFDQVDREADEWRTREIAKDIAKRKVEKMKEIARVKAKEEKKRLDSELELALIVEKLHELRSIRIQKLKKQGHFLPEEDDKFLEKVRAAVEEEERQALAAADTDAARDAIATAEVSRKTIPNYSPESKDPNSNAEGCEERNDQRTATADDKVSNISTNKEPGKQFGEGQGCGRVYDYAANLPMKFYHYYYGSNTDMGTLIEVRRSWDAYLRPGGSRIPGHWVQPSPPADEIWAAYLVGPK